jgi:chitinase
MSDPPEATFEFWRLRTGRYLESPAYARHWSTTAQVPYLYDRESRTFITYDDERSIRGKMDYLKSRGLRGAMYWEISADHERALATTIARELRH